MKTTDSTPLINPWCSTARLLIAALLICGSFVVAPPARALVSTNVYFSQAAPWHGWMNWYNNWDDYTNGVTSTGGSSSWGVGTLPAVWNPTYAAVTVSPNTSVYNANDPYWVNGDGSGAKIMEGNFYVDDDGLTNKLIVFSGYCWANTLAQPYYTKVFIKVFNSTYSQFVAQTNKLVAPGQAFSISVFAPTGSHPQYGCFTVGPDANPATVSTLGYALLSSNPLPSSVTIAAPPQNSYAIVGGKANFSVLAFGSSLTYQWKKDGSAISGATTSALTLNNVAGDSQAIYTVSVSDGTTTAAASARLTVLDPNHLTVDLNAPWLGFMNWYINNGGTMGPYVGGGNWATADLRSSIGQGVISLLPNTNVYNANDPYWVNPDGSGAKWMEALFFQECDGLSGQTVTFSGFCQSNSLVSPYNCKAYIREFLPDYSAFDEMTVSLVPGQPFTVTKFTGAGDHVQWGFATAGPDANPATASTLGLVQVSASHPPYLIARPNGSSVALSFGTDAGCTYHVKYKTNLNDGFWKTLVTTNGTGSTVNLQDTTGATSRFYALFVQ